ncbi:hypothetical protein PYR71_11650 [Rhizobium sp. MC63]|uniref:Uncharacterized protein n=1 Tax=Rhizobium mulingense TaxID=3031128 RepID=A0ACC6MUI0_9HYPH|nr:MULTISPECIES: hypothetical protein [unclassified Rhizobium]MDF0697152.1 hypothetical protein [Rhizobium sp. MC63]MEA3516818.1 hypothetical protein [Rhizobium sp. MJ31]
MSKTNVRDLQKRAEQQVKNTSAGGHLGGTYSASNPTAKPPRTAAMTAPRLGRTMGAIEAIADAASGRLIRPSAQ